MIERNKYYILMRVTLFIFFATCVVCTSGCSEDELTSTPSIPIFVEKSSDTARYDRGIRPIYVSDPDDNHGLYLQWYENAEKDLEGYKLYRTTETVPLTNGKEVPVNFQLLKDIPLGSQDIKQLPDTAYEDYSVKANETYYYRLTAYSTSGGESLPSSTYPSYMLRTGSALITPNGGFPMPEDSLITFEWSPYTQFSGGRHLLKVYSINDFTGEETLISQTSFDGGYSGNIKITVDYTDVGASGAPSFFGGLKTVIYTPLISSGTSAYGQRYYWRVYALESGIDNLVGSITQGNFEITN